jgi:hypothetical protein
MDTSGRDYSNDTSNDSAGAFIGKLIRNVAQPKKELDEPMQYSAAPGMLEQTRKRAIEQFQRRVRFAREKRESGEYPDNGDLHAESPMFFYCQHCGVLIEILPEDYLFQPHKLCSQCAGLQKQGWLDDVKQDGG